MSKDHSLNANNQKKTKGELNFVKTKKQEFDNMKMAHAQQVDLSSDNNDKYEHKKFQVKRSYAHKKFGTRVTKSVVESKVAATESVEKEATPLVTTKRSPNDIFRPYALPDNTPRKRKYQEIETEIQPEEMDVKRFAPTPLPSSYSSINLTPTPTPCAIPTPGGYLLNPYYRMQQYQFNPQTFALILQKQRAALCMGEILKRQANLNLYNLMGQ
ncbi:uncharacterized protein ACRADG_003979 [Cochliomyia hominivorax]